MDVVVVGAGFTDDQIGRAVEFGGTYTHWSEAHILSDPLRHELELVKGLEIEEVRWMHEGEAHRSTAA